MYIYMYIYIYIYTYIYIYIYTLIFGGGRGGPEGACLSPLVSLRIRECLSNGKTPYSKGKPLIIKGNPLWLLPLLD